MSSVLPLTSPVISQQKPVRASVSVGMVSFHHANTRWIAKADLIDELFDSTGLKLAEWIRNEQTTIVKNGPHRTVYRLQLPSGSYFLKHFKANDWKTKFRQLFTPCRAELEYRAVQRVAELGIPTFETVATGKQHHFANWGVTDNYLISQEITDVISVQDYVNNTGQNMPATIRHQLATQLGNIVGKLHNGGLLHRDLHSDNLLMKIDCDQQLHLWLIDLHAVSFAKQINTEQIERNLALLIPSFFRDITKADILRFFHSYWKTLHDSSSQITINIFSSKNKLFCRLTKSWRKTALDIFAKQDKKWSRGNRRLIIANNDNTQCRGLTAIGKEKLITLRDNPSQIKTTSFQHITSAKDVAIREDESSNFSARSAWEMGHAFLRRGFNTPRPMMFASHSDKEYLVTEEVTNLPALTEKLQTVSKAERNAISRRLASRFAQLHKFGYDTSFDAENLRVGGSPERPEIWFYNLDNVTHSSPLTTTQIVASFQKLHHNLTTSKLISQTDTIRFLKRYTPHNSSIHWKQFFRTTETTTK